MTIDSLSAAPHTKVLTWRSALFGFLGVYLISGLAAYHDDILGGTLMVGNHIPGGAFTYVISLGLFWNGFWALAHKFTGRGRSMILNSRELAVVMALTLAACYAPTSGLFRYFQRAIMVPWNMLAGKPTWIEHGLLTEHMRRNLFPTPWPGEIIASGGAEPPGYEIIYRGFFTGLATGKSTLPLSELWRMGIFKAWAGPLMTWGPFVVLLAIAIVSIQYLAHRQWSKHEQLSYPVAQVAAGFCTISNDVSGGFGDGSRGGARGVPDIFINRLFWWGFVPVSCVLLVHVLSSWYPQNVPGITEIGPNLKWWWLPVNRAMPVLNKVPGWWGLGWQQIFFCIVGLSYFVSSEISLTMGITMAAQCAFCVMFYYATGIQVDDGWMGMSRAGAYVGFTAILVWTGRNYYARVFGKALRFRTPRDDEEALSVAAARILAFSFAGFVMVTAWLCGSWFAAVFYSLFAMIMFLGISRIVCETGVPFIHTHWDPGWLLVRLFGPAAIGPSPLVFSLHSAAVLSHDPRESLMPYIATGAKVAEENGVRLRRLYWVVLGAVLLSIAIAFVATTYAYYNYNCNPISNNHAVTWPPQQYFDAAARYFSDMKASGVYDDSASASVLGRFRFIDAKAWDIKFFVAGLAGVMLLSSVRFRFSKFPIHPVMFLVAGTYGYYCIWGSFLLGWFIKTLVVKFGGGGVYQRLKPLFIGMIAAELFMVGAMVALDFAYKFIFGTPPPAAVSILPG